MGTHLSHSKERSIICILGFLEESALQEREDILTRLLKEVPKELREAELVLVLQGPREGARET